MQEPSTHQSALVNLNEVGFRIWDHFNPPPDLTVTQWAMLNRHLPEGTTARPGPFLPETFQTEIMDIVLNPKVHEVVIQKYCRWSQVL